MKLRVGKKMIILATMLLCSVFTTEYGVLFAQQSINKLKKEQSNLKKKIKNTDAKLSETQRSTRQSLRELERLNADIVYRDLLIKRRSSEIENYNKEIEALNKNVSNLSVEYEKMREKYLDMLYYAYLTKSKQEQLLYVLSSRTFEEGYRRFYYLSNLASMRKEQSIALSKTKKDIQNKRDKVNNLKNKTKELLLKQEKEKEFSLFQKEKQNKLVKSLKNREQELKAELRKQQKASNQLNQKIQDLIAKQTAESAKKQKSKSAAKSGGYSMTQKEKVVAGGFAKNKGLLMWPTKGTITGKFGKHTHPVLKDVIVNNKGIYITAVPGSKASCIYDGVVSQCFSVPGSNNAVIVRHGNYLTVYANLTEMYVKKGDNVKRGTSIGKIYQDPDNKNNATLFFQIWKEKELLNPQSWLRK